jgi:aspartate/methionine/tyrosine aminotransferase
MGYWESAPLKARLARHYAETFGVEVAADQIQLTCGASAALVAALAGAFSPGQTIAIARPGYVAYRNALKALNLVPLELDIGAADDYRLSARRIEALEVAPDGIIIASPANPTGAVIAPDELARLAAVCRERGVTIISDEIYHGLSYGPVCETLLRHAPDALVINSFSKYYSMAPWRIGWLVTPRDRAEHFRAYVANLFLTAPSLAQHAALAAMDAHDELEGHLAVYAANRALMLEAMPRLGVTGFAPPDGAFYIYADVGALTDDSLAFCEAMVRETGVAAAPGIDFDPVNGGRFVRFSFAVSTDEIRDALSRLEPWFAARRAPQG